METLRIQILVGHCLGGEGRDVYPGDVLSAPGDISPEAAELKVRRGWARVIPNAIETRDPAPETRDPEVKEPASQPAHKGRPRAGGR